MIVNDTINAMAANYAIAGASSAGRTYVAQSRGFVDELRRGTRLKRGCVETGDTAVQFWGRSLNWSL